MSSTTREDLNAHFSSFNINPTTSATKPRKAAPPALADSWEEADPSSSSSSDDDDDQASSSSSPNQPRKSHHHSSAPPPTPISPTIRPTSGTSSSIAERFGGEYADRPETGERVRRREEGEGRQEKTDAVAKRMIAGALGVRVPKKTEEGKAYERALREGVMRRREREKEEKEEEERERRERERARVAVWED